MGANSTWSQHLFTTEAQRHRGKPGKGKRNAGRRLGILHVGSRGGREHRDFCDHVGVLSAHFGLRVRIFQVATKGQASATTSTISPCSPSPPPPLCAALRATTQDHNSRRPIFLGFPLCLCASVVNLHAAPPLTSPREGLSFEYPPDARVERS